MNPFLSLLFIFHYFQFTKVILIWFILPLFVVEMRDRVIELHWIGNRLSDCDSKTCVAYNNVSLTKQTHTHTICYLLIYYYPFLLQLFPVRPLTIKLNQDIKFLSTNHSYDLKCEVVGARPTPTITWWKGSTQMRTTREWVS